MKKIRREETKVIYTDVYVSVDGKEFTNEADCRAWETSYKGTMEASWQLIEKREVSDVALGLPWSSDDHECYVVRPKNLDEITVINAYVQSSTNNNGTMLTSKHINELVALNFGYDHDYCDIYALGEHLDDITKHIIELENELKENA